MNTTDLLLNLLTTKFDGPCRDLCWVWVIFPIFESSAGQVFWLYKAGIGDLAAIVQVFARGDTVTAPLSTPRSHCTSVTDCAE